MAGIVNISHLSSLNFDHSWMKYNYAGYWWSQPFISTDFIRTQVSCYPEVIPTFTLLNSKNETQQIYVTTFPTETDTVYDIFFTGLEVDEYHFQIIVNGTLQAESFFCIICEERASETVLFRYTGDDHHLGGVYEDEDGNILYFEFRIDAQFLPGYLTPNVENYDFRDQNSNAVQLSAFPYDVETLTVGVNYPRSIHGVPEWVASRLNYILSLPEVYINDQGYVRSGSAVPEKEQLSPGNPFFIITIDLEKSEIEERTYLRVSPLTLEFGGNSTVYKNVTVESNRDWDIEVSADWIVAVISGSSLLRIRCVTNTTGSTRYGTVTVRSSDSIIERVIEVIQYRIYDDWILATGNWRMSGVWRNQGAWNY